MHKVLIVLCNLNHSKTYTGLRKGSGHHSLRSIDLYSDHDHINVPYSMRSFSCSSHLAHRPLQYNSVLFTEHDARVMLLQGGHHGADAYHVHESTDHYADHCLSSEMADHIHQSSPHRPNSRREKLRFGEFERGYSPNIRGRTPTESWTIHHLGAAHKRLSHAQEAAAHRRQSVVDDWDVNSLEPASHPLDLSQMMKAVPSLQQARMFQHSKFILPHQSTRARQLTAST